MITKNDAATPSQSVPVEHHDLQLIRLAALTVLLLLAPLRRRTHWPFPRVRRPAWRRAANAFYGLTPASATRCGSRPALTLTAKATDSRP